MRGTNHPPFIFLTYFYGDKIMDTNKSTTYLVGKIEEARKHIPIGFKQLEYKVRPEMVKFEIDIIGINILPDVDNSMRGIVKMIFDIDIPSESTDDGIDCMTEYPEWFSNNDSILYLGLDKETNQPTWFNVFLLSFNVAETKAHLTKEQEPAKEEQYVDVAE